MKKNSRYYLVKLNRITGWCLFFLVPILFLTGYGISGTYDWTSVIASAEVHSKIHKFCIPMTIVFFSLHAAVNFYFALKRWRKN
jgi:hypothetical protein